MWMTIWLKGAVVAVIGFNGMTEEHCEEMQALALADIEAGVVVAGDDMYIVDPETGEHLEWGEYKITCEETPLEIGTTDD